MAITSTNSEFRENADGIAEELWAVTGDGAATSFTITPSKIKAIYTSQAIPLTATAAGATHTGGTNFYGASSVTYTCPAIAAVVSYIVVVRGRVS